MARLQRSVTTFRRSGSSGMVWDENFLPGDLSRIKKKEEEGVAGFKEETMGHSKSMGSTGNMGRRSSIGGSRQVVFPAGFVSPAADPPSPDVPRCLCCGFFSQNRSANRFKPRRR
ncbi:uncharacterized protein At1g15400-like [Musa acuminata AAA Group]|uniref:uncharacterized protein At1g15400-like n=1 Tax=Musa acuminata AAA Group TaxID=214697 RepID=UPI0031D0348D